jgi:hypothetical protein
MSGNRSANEKQPFIIKCPLIVGESCCGLVMCCKEIPGMKNIIAPFYCCLLQNYWYYSCLGGLDIRDRSGAEGGTPGSIGLPHCPWSLCSICGFGFKFLPYDCETVDTSKNNYL